MTSSALTDKWTGLSHPSGDQWSDWVATLEKILEKHEKEGKLEL